MSINTIGQLNSYGGGFGGGGISEETRRKLIALGIDPRTVTSEAQAQILIKNAVQIRKNSKVPLPVNISCGEQELIFKAKNLASKLGIVVSGNTPLNQILTAISDKIAKGGFDEFEPEFLSIKEMSEVVRKNENDMFASMNYNASINKMMLGL